MRISDLADTVKGTAGSPSMGHTPPCAGIQGASPNRPSCVEPSPITSFPPRHTTGGCHAPQGLKWLLLDSKLLDGEHVLIVFEKRWLTEARQAYPGTVIYFPPEVEELKRIKDAPDTVKFLHRIKKEFGAWIVPSNRERSGR